MNTDNANNIARKILASGVLNEPKKYTFKDLCRIRDYTEGLLDYFPNEKWLIDLLAETKKYIEQKAEL